MRTVTTSRSAWRSPDSGARVAGCVVGGTVCDRADNACTMKLELRNDDGELVDEYELPPEEYYRVTAPDGALIAEMS